MATYDPLTANLIHDPLTTNLDNLLFQQDLVDEARKRIVRYCPEWTEYNVSDPGITLIELFAWMTEQLIYRLNQVPRKNYVKFMGMLGIQLEPPVAAKTELTFYLSAPFPLHPENRGAQPPVVIPAGTQVSATAPDSAAITFTTDEALEIVTPQLTHLRRQQDFMTNHWRSTGTMIGFAVFDASHSGPWAYFYLGFDPKQNLAGHIVRLHVECGPAQGSGIERNRPPWVWRACVGDETEPVGGLRRSAHRPAVERKEGFGARWVHEEGKRWEIIDIGETDEERDTTGGFNNATGQVALYLPLDMKRTALHGFEAYWVRCALCTEPDPHSERKGHYTGAPVLQQLSVVVLGASTTATNAVVVNEELVGVSTGEPGQFFQLKQTPLLPPKENPAANGQMLEVEEVILAEKQDEKGNKSVFEPHPVAWQQVDNFADSTPHDRHYTLDAATGEIRFGPAIRQRDGSIRQYGRIPATGMRIRMRNYRYSRGAQGNAPSHRVTVLHKSIAYVDRVTNRERVIDGRDAESLEEAMLRAQRFLRAQQRAVTASDYELLAKHNDRSIARVKCITPYKDGVAGNDAEQPLSSALAPGAVRVLVVPAAYEVIQQHVFSQLAVTPELERTVRGRLGAVRLLTSTLDVQEPNYLGIFVDATIVVDDRRDPRQVENAVNRALCHYITPLRPAPGAPSQNGDADASQKINIEIDPTSDPVLVRAQVEAALQRLAGRPAANTAANSQPDDPAMAPPLVADLARTEPGWDGWPFGEPLSKAELFAKIQAVPGVRHVREVDIYRLRIGVRNLTELRGAPEPPLNRSSTEEEIRNVMKEKNYTRQEAIDALVEANDYLWELVDANRLPVDGLTFDEGTLLCSPLDHRVTAVPL